MNSYSFVILAVLINLPLCLLHCSKYYILIEKYHDDIFNATQLKLNDEDNPTDNKLRLYKNHINWDKYEINHEVFNPDCVIDLHCSQEKSTSTCLPIKKPKNIYGPDTRVTETIRVKTNTSTESEEAAITRTISNKHTSTDNSSVDSSKEATAVKNVNNTTPTEAEKAKIKSTLSDKPTFTGDSSVDTSDKATAVKNAVNTESEKPVIISSTTDRINDTTPTEAEKAKLKSTLSNKPNFSGDSSVDSSDKATAVNNSVATETEGLEINYKAEEFNHTSKTNHRQQIKLDDLVEASRTKDKPDDGTVSAGKIAAGIVGAGAAIAIITVSMKYIAGCLQSGAYRVSEPC